MHPFKKSTRDAFLKSIQKAFQLHTQSKKPGSPPYSELVAQHSEEKSSLHRRDFISNLGKATILIGTAGLVESCRKISDLLPQETNGTGVNNFASRPGQPRIAIVGAGIAGLNCAYELKKSNLYATVYEASARAGGRILTKNNFVAQGLYAECGGEFIDSGHKHMLKLVRDFGLSLIDTQVPGETALAKDSFYIDGHYYTEAEVMNAFGPYAQQIADDINSLPNYFGFDNYNATVLGFDQMSISGYFDSIGLPSSGFLRKGLETAYNTEYGREVNDQTAINFLFLFSINPRNNTYQIFGASDEQYKVNGGNQQITDALYNEVNSQVVMDCILTRITKNNNEVYTLYFNNGTTSKADIVVLTIPFTILKDVDLSNLSLPAWKVNAIQNLGYGTNAKLIMGFNSRVWRNYLQSGYVFTNGTPQNPSHYIQTGWDSSQLQNSNNGSYTVFQGGHQGTGLHLGQTSIFLNQLDAMWEGTAAQYNGISKLIHWPSNPYTKGSYSCWRVGQVTTIKGAEYLPVGNLFFAGEHTSSNNQGYMEGGAETGKLVAKAIVRIAV